MTNERLAKLAKQREVGGQKFYTIYGMCEKIEGRTAGSKTSINQMMKYVKEGCPCFEHAGSVLFDTDLNNFMEWLKTRRPMRQVKAMARSKKLQGGF